jgi:hypothetical protein
MGYELEAKDAISVIGCLGEKAEGVGLCRKFELFHWRLCLRVLIGLLGKEG